MRFLPCGTILLSIVFTGTALAQKTAQNSLPDDSLAAASRQARELKKQQPKAIRVWDNDNIPKNPGTLSVIGEASAQAPSSSSNSNSQPGSASGEDKPASPAKAAQNLADKKKALESELAAAKDQLQNLQNDLDIMQHKLALDQQMYYSKPEYSSDKAGAAALADEQGQIDAKQVEMGTVEQKVAGLKAQLDALSEQKPADK